MERQIIQDAINKLEPLDYAPKSKDEMISATNSARFLTRKHFGDFSEYSKELERITKSFPDWKPPLSLDEKQAWEEIWNSCKNDMLELLGAILEAFEKK